MRRKLLVAALVTASTALAVKPGETLYIKSKDTQVLKDPKAGSKPVTKLQPGDEVIWNGPSDKDKQFHSVEAKGKKKGFVLQANLTPNKPQEEIDQVSGAPMNEKARASMAAATKALTPAGINYAKNKGDDAPKALEAAAEVIYTEEHNKVKATPEAIAAKGKELGGVK